ncbi:hypothetical protein [Arcobacter sp. F2176]|uniref:hypothetical protein n=1 Tax=Arcobacter sp. F2176 TaxID=2044511 RepID=UPI00100B0B23|nr:hypothetical protein [Arcobacter sp. F2176]RXJ82646.1 hypothetical protein CRU95_00855 [Arcobacter sp. F2176]
MGDGVDYRMEIVANSKGDKTEDNITKGIMSNVKSKGSNFGSVDFNNSFFDDISGIGEAPTAPTSTVSGGLLNTMKNNADTISKSMNNVAEVLNKSNLVSKEHVNATQNMAQSITSAMTLLANILSVANGHKEVGNRLQNYHNNVNTQKNFLQIDKLEYDSKPLSNIVDVNGKPVIPRQEKVKANVNQNEYHNFNKNGAENLKDTSNNRIAPRMAKARYHEEKAQDEERMNKFDWGNHLDSLTGASDEINNHGSNLLDEVINMHSLDEDSINKIDDEIKKINWGDINNG